jgi:hypothetical protein
VLITAMKKQIIIASQRLKVIWDNPKEWVRRKMQESIQSLLEEETAELLGRRESER